MYTYLRLLFAFLFTLVLFQSQCSVYARRYDPFGNYIGASADRRLRQAASECQAAIDERPFSGSFPPGEIYHIGKLCCYQHAECYANCVSEKDECDDNFALCSVAECFAHLSGATSEGIDGCNSDYSWTNSWMHETLSVMSAFSQENYTEIHDIAKCGIDPKLIVLPEGVPE